MSDEADLPVEVPDKLFFRIGEASQLVGVEPHVLRYWESEFKMRPQRSSTGQRMYRRKDIAHFFRIRKLLHDQGFTIAGARKVFSGAAAPAATAESDPLVIRQTLDKVNALRKKVAESRKRLSGIATIGSQR